MGSLGRKLQEVNFASIPVDVSREGHGDEDEERTVCPDLVLILGALLCALILALLINYVVRWLLRCARVVVTVPVPVQLQPRQGSGSASASAKDAFAALPSVVYQRGEARKMKGDSECAICLAEFGDGEKLCVLPACGHCFHGSCIRQWIASACHPSCPTCRANLHSSTASAAATAAACTCSPPSMSLFIALPLLPSSPRRPS